MINRKTYRLDRIFGIKEDGDFFISGICWDIKTKEKHLIRIICSLDLMDSLLKQIKEEEKNKD